MNLAVLIENQRVAIQFNLVRYYKSH